MHGKRVPPDVDFTPFVPRPARRAAAEIRSEAPDGDAILLLPPAAAPAVEPPRADQTCDPAVCAAVMRAEAVRLAAIACSRALHEAVARNPLFVARFVDDAVRSASGDMPLCVRVAAGAAPLCAGSAPCEVTADDALPPGAVIVETAHGTLGATLEERAAILVRAAADA